MKLLFSGIAASLLIVLLILTFFVPPAPRAIALGNPCAADPNNLTTNGSMAGPGYSAPPYGIVASSWTPFLLSADLPVFEWVNYNSNGDVANTGSQYIWSDYQPYGAGPFDAGIYQTITGLTAGKYYRFWIGFAQAAYDLDGSGNQRTNTIGRQAGVDRMGGSSPTSPNVEWGEVYWDGIAALNIPALSLTFAPQNNSATIFLRVVNQNNIGRSKVWFDAVCMELLNPQPPTPGIVFLPFVKRE
jgi:hypothetical protein